MATKQRLQPWQNGHFGSKIKNAKNHAKNVFYEDIAVVLCKKRLEKTADILKNESISENWQKWPPSKVLYSLAKWSGFGVAKIKNAKKHAKNVTTKLQLLYAKNGLKKLVVSRKMRAF